MIRYHTVWLLYDMVSVTIQAHGLQFDQGLILESGWSLEPVQIPQSKWDFHFLTPQKIGCDTFKILQRSEIILFWLRNRHGLLKHMIATLLSYWDSTWVLSLNYYYYTIVFCWVVLPARFWYCNSIITVIHKIDNKNTIKSIYDQGSAETVK